MHETESDNHPHHQTTDVPDQMNLMQLLMNPPGEKRRTDGTKDQNE